ncbi:MAG: general secretion pathway protein GspL [Burkholderiales bacterium]|nr:general secretion pathway protein GspL [Burkholderiales bacterium]MDE2075681.1 general secretion pathway protein GspL [Burkholderiales bacterium]MDE2432118.1 general secretion pathway protein GspL [Burkholderiales bacterium]
MSFLILQLPARARLSAESAESESGGNSSINREYAYVLSPDGQAVSRHGRCVANMLPRADMVIAVMAPTDLSWHQVALPKAPGAKLRAALAGILEDALLDEPDNLHFAVEPVGRAGEKSWVAVCDHTWLTSQLMALEKAKIRVQRVVPAVCPDEPATAYFHESNWGGEATEPGANDVLLTWSTVEGVSTWPIDGSLARVLLPDSLSEQVRFFATPAVAAPAERWLGRVVTVQTQAEHLLLAARSMWNLLQFDLTPQSKGLYAVSDQWRRFMGIQWRPVRLGLIYLAVAQLVGLNLWAWHQARTVKQKRAEMVTILKQAYPQVQVVIDPYAQMQKETDLLRAAAGQIGDSDLESLMAAAATVWPADEPSASIQYDGVSLTLTAPRTWSPADIEQIRNRLSAAGVVLETAGDGRLTLHRAGRS